MSERILCRGHEYGLVSSEYKRNCGVEVRFNTGVHFIGRDQGAKFLADLKAVLADTPSYVRRMTLDFTGLDFFTDFEVLIEFARLCGLHRELRIKSVASQILGSFDFCLALYGVRLTDLYVIEGSIVPPVEPSVRKRLAA